MNNGGIPIYSTPIPNRYVYKIQYTKSLPWIDEAYMTVTLTLLGSISAAEQVITQVYLPCTHGLGNHYLSGNCHISNIITAKQEFCDNFTVVFITYEVTFN